MRFLQIVLALALGAFYLWVFSLVFRPEVSAEYRAYFIDRSTSDWRPVRYAATPSEGFDFAREGLPSFVALTIGISQRESWGRWSDANLAPAVHIRVKVPLVGRVCLGLLANAAPPQAGKPVEIRLGSARSRFVPPDTQLRLYRIELSPKRAAHEIEMTPSVPRKPSTWNKASRDQRRIALGLRRLTIVPGPCPK